MSGKTTPKRPRGRPRGSAEPKPLETILRALDIIDCLCRSPGSLGISDIVKDVKLPAPTIYRALVSFTSRGIVSYDPATHRYSMGVRFMQYGLQQLNNIKIRQAVHKYLADISAETQETAVLALRAGFDRVYIDQIESPQPVRHVQKLWEQIPLYLGSSGRCILAFLPEEEIESYLATGPFPKLTENTLSDPDQLRDRLEEIRARKMDFAIAERLSDTAAVAAPILDHTGIAIGSILVCGPFYRASFVDRYASLVRQAAHQCSLDIGYSADPDDSTIWASVDPTTPGTAKEQAS